MSISHQQLYGFLEQHKGNGYHAIIDALDEGRTCVTLVTGMMQEVGWMESDSSVPVLAGYLYGLGYAYSFASSAYQSLVDISYELYKSDWCKKRGYNIAEADEEHGFNGEIYACKDEFLTAEFFCEYYMEQLLPADDFALWLIYVAGQDDEPDVIPPTEDETSKYYYVVKNSFDPHKVVCGPYHSECEAWTALVKASQAEFSVDLEERNCLGLSCPECNTDSEIMEVTIVTEDTDGSKNVTEYFVIEAPC